jgi:hypothetical protein
MTKATQLFVVALILLGGISVQAQDLIYDGPSQWSDFDEFMREREEEDRVTGLSYIISGAIATVGGIAGYYSSQDSFSRGAYAITQTVGIMSLGYGASIYYNGNEYDSFYRAVRDSSLSPLQKTEILRRFLENEKAELKRSQWIRTGTHILLAAVNFYSANQEKDKDVKGLFQFLGAVNAAIAISYAF